MTEHACNTQAKQNNKTMLLSPHAHVVSCPQLQVHNKKVSCSHGSAVGQLDEQHLFYLRSRGMNQKAARCLLLRAFLTLPFAKGGVRSCNKKFQKTLSQKIQEMV